MEETPIFVKVDGYKDVLNTIKLIKNKLGQAKDTLNKISDLKHKEDSELSLWYAGLEDVQKRIELVDKELFEPESI